MIVSSLAFKLGFTIHRWISHVGMRVPVCGAQWPDIMRHLGIVQKVPFSSSSSLTAISRFTGRCISAGEAMLPAPLPFFLSSFLPSFLPSGADVSREGAARHILLYL